MIDTKRDGTGATRTGNRLADIPAGRMGSTDDIANLCLFLCTDAGDYISGQTIHVNGGERTFGG
jgi:NAD(P)-dependent dehydrogenase (short-subunit alcohol dehydrogenase family)